MESVPLSSLHGDVQFSPLKYSHSYTYLQLLTTPAIDSTGRCWKLQRLRSRLIMLTLPRSHDVPAADVRLLDNIISQQHIL